METKCLFVNSDLSGAATIYGPFLEITDETYVEVARKFGTTILSYDCDVYGGITSIDLDDWCDGQKRISINYGDPAQEEYAILDIGELTPGKPFRMVDSCHKDIKFQTDIEYPFECENVIDGRYIIAFTKEIGYAMFFGPFSTIDLDKYQTAAIYYVDKVIAEAYGLHDRDYSIRFKETGYANDTRKEVVIDFVGKGLTSFYIGDIAQGDEFIL